MKGKLRQISNKSAGVLFLLVFLANTSCSTKNKIAFGSCLNQHQPQKIWQSISKKNPDLFFFVGDSIYPKDNSPISAEKSFRKLNSKKEYIEFKNKFTVEAIWDDHDYGLNDGGNDYQYKNQAKKIFLDAFDVDKESCRRQREGIYFSKAVDKKIQIIALDTRFNKDELSKRPKLERLTFSKYFPTYKKGASILGEEQWKWLEKELKKDYEIKLIISSTQLIPNNNKKENWSNFPFERKRFFKLLKITDAKNVVILSGDVHRASIYSANPKETGLDYQLYEITASNMNLRGKSKKKKSTSSHTASNYTYTGENFGLIVVDDSSIKLQIHNLNGDIIFSEEVSLG